jgi:CheY-like chemotaxis protein
MADNMRVNNPVVLMVDDEKEVADAYALRLEGVAEVTVEYSGGAALATLEEGLTPDVVLLDRHMPGKSGDEILADIREMDLRTQIIMVTAIDPNLGILDLLKCKEKASRFSAGRRSTFDDYLSKPVEREDLRTAVDQQCQVLAYELLGEYFRLESKRAVIEAEVPDEQLQDHEEFAGIEERTAATADRVRALLPEADDLLTSFSDIDREGY